MRAVWMCTVLGVGRFAHGPTRVAGRERVEGAWLLPHEIRLERAGQALAPQRCLMSSAPGGSEQGGRGSAGGWLQAGQAGVRGAQDMDIKAGDLFSYCDSLYRVTSVVCGTLASTTRAVCDRYK